MQLMLVTDLEAVAGVGWIGDYAQIALCAMEPAGLERAASLIARPARGRRLAFTAYCSSLNSVRMRRH